MRPLSFPITVLVEFHLQTLHGCKNSLIINIMSAPNNVEPNFKKALYYTLLFFSATVAFESMIVYIGIELEISLPWGQFLFYMIMHVVGFVFVNYVNLQNERRSLLVSGNDTYKDLYVVLGFAVLQYAMGGYIVLKDPYYSEDTFCNYILFNKEHSCENVDFYDTVVYNSLFWTLPYYCGLLFTFSDQGIMQQFSFSSEFIA